MGSLKYSITVIRDSLSVPQDKKGGPVSNVIMIMTSASPAPFIDFSVERFLKFFYDSGRYPADYSIRRNIPGHGCPCGDH